MSKQITVVEIGFLPHVFGIGAFLYAIGFQDTAIHLQ